MDNEDKIMLEVIQRKNGTTSVYLSDDGDYNILLSTATTLAELVSHRYEISIERVSELMIDLAKRVPVGFENVEKRR